MFDTDFDCGTECGGPGPPPKFLLPPPPRPPFMQDLNTQCSEDPIHDGDVCDAIPVSSRSHFRNYDKISRQRENPGQKINRLRGGSLESRRAEWEWPLIKTSNVARLLSSSLFDNISMDGLLTSQFPLPCHSCNHSLLLVALQQQKMLHKSLIDYIDLGSPPPPLLFAAVSAIAQE